MHLVVDDNRGDEGELLDVTVQLLVLEHQSDVGHELAELIELGWLQRDGITRLDVHLRTILADGHARTPITALSQGTMSPSSPGSGAGTWGSIRSRASTSRVETSRSRTHFRSAGTTCQGAQPVEVAASVSS